MTQDRPRVYLAVIADSHIPGDPDPRCDVAASPEAHPRTDRGICVYETRRLPSAHSHLVGEALTKNRVAGCNRNVRIAGRFVEVCQEWNSQTTCQVGDQLTLADQSLDGEPLASTPRILDDADELRNPTARSDNDERKWFVHRPTMPPSINYHHRISRLARSVRA